MTAYNFVNGVSACEHKKIFNDILRSEWGFDGFVVSDWFALHSSALDVTDLEMPGPSVHRRLEVLKARYDAADEKGKAAMMKDIGRCVTNILRMVDRVKGLGYCKHPADEVEGSVAEADVGPAIRQTGAEGAVLLKNDNELLPLQLRKGMKIVCIGVPWVEAVQSGGGSANLTAQKVAQPIDALRRAIAEAGLDEKDVEVVHQVGCPIHNFVHPLEVSMKCEYYSGREVGKGELVGTDVVQNATIKTSDSKPEAIKPNDYWIRTSLTTPAAERDGKYRLGLVGLGKIQASGTYEDGRNTPAWSFEGESDMFEYLLNPRRVWEGYELEIKKGQSVVFSCDYLPLLLPEEWKHLHYCGMQVGLEFVEDEDAMIEEASKQASTADAAVILTASGKDWESEGYDREHMRLPRRQNDLVQRVSENVKGKTIVLNITGSPIELPWLDHVAALVQAWYGGQEGGESLIDVLFGRGEAPACGRLANTWPKVINDHPSAVDQSTFPGQKESGKEGPQVSYSEGRLVGYRHYNSSDKAAEPAYYFGFGLGGFTTFSSEGPFTKNHDVQINSVADLPLALSVKTKNTGNRSGKQIIQLYVRKQSSATDDEPKQRLAAYKAVRLQAGKEASTELTVRQDAFSHWDQEQDAWLVSKGTYEIVLANSAELSDTIGSVVVAVNKSWTWKGIGV